MRLEKGLILFFLINIYGCSFISWVNYTDTADYPEWNSGSGYEIGRGSDLNQPSWEYQVKDVSIKVLPFPLNGCTLTFGPPYLPIIPFYQFHLIYGLFSSEEESLIITISIKSKSENSYIDLSKISAIVRENKNIHSFILTDTDSTSILNWKVMDFNSNDSTNCKVKLSKKDFSFQLGLPKMIEKEDSVIIKINGVYSTDKKIDFPELILVKKSKFHFQGFQFGV